MKAKKHRDEFTAVKEALLSDPIGGAATAIEILKTRKFETLNVVKKDNKIEILDAESQEVILSLTPGGAIMLGLELLHIMKVPSFRPMD